MTEFIFYQKIAEYTFFSNVYGIFTKKDYIVGHESNLNNFKWIQFIPGMFSDYTVIELEISDKKDLSLKSLAIS